ncbi:MAG: sigma-70 family RNA polymerase sigma factor [Planctomycetota bacterium]
MKEPPDSTLDRKAFVLDALERYERKLTAYSQRLCNGDLHSARDVVQHAFLQLCRQDPQDIKGKLGPWLYTVCRNRVYDESKSKKRRPVSTPDDFEATDYKSEDPAGQLERKDFLAFVRNRFDKFPEPEREVVELWSHGFNTSEIADILKKKPGTVRVNLHRAMQRLKRIPEIKVWLERATGQVNRRNSGSDCNEETHDQSDLHSIHAPAVDRSTA